MGLGLAIAGHIAAQHGGSIEVESHVGKGSRFTVSLPVADGGAGGGDDQMVAAPEPVRQSAGR
jgi:nitrogen-specific signal transduction histidine kinase